MVGPTFVGRLHGFQVSALSCQSKLVGESQVYLLDDDHFAWLVFSFVLRERSLAHDPFADPLHRRCTSDDVVAIAP